MQSILKMAGSLSARALIVVALTTPALVTQSSVASAQAEASVEIVVECAETGPAVAVCAALGVILHEVVKLLNGEDGFGENGEIMRLLALPVGNFQAAEGDGFIVQMFAGATGINLIDFFRCPVRGCSDESVVNQIVDAIEDLFS